MVAPLKKKHTLAQTGFQLTDTGFLYQGTPYRFADVIETKRFRSVLETKFVTGDSISKDHSISVVFVMNSGVNIQLTEQPTWTSGSKVDNVEQIEQIFETVSRKTWENRIGKYTRQVDELGYFDYGGWRLYPKRLQIVDIEKAETYDILETTFSKRYGFIALTKKNAGIGSRLLRKMITGERGISTLVDTDVFFALLKHYFRLEWRY